MYQKIMVTLDGSPLAECVLPHVENIIQGNKTAEIMLVQAVEPIAIPYGREIAKFASLDQLKTFEAHNEAQAKIYLAGASARLSKTGANVKTYIVYGKAADALTDFAAKSGADLVIMTTHGHSGISRWGWGSVADRLLRAITVPILVIRASTECAPASSQQASHV